MGRRVACGWSCSRLFKMFHAADRSAVDDATALMAAFGEGAAFEAAARADRSRDLGNTIRFCHWRQIERLITILHAEPEGLLH
jgi:hypothetical protein